MLYPQTKHPICRGMAVLTLMILAIAGTALPVYSQRTSSEADSYIAGISGPVDKARLKRVLVADRETLAGYIRGQDTVLARLAIGEARKRKDAALSAVLLERVYDRRDTTLSASAANALGEVSGNKTPNGLEKALRDSRVEVRVAAALVLGRYGKRVAIPALREALARQEPETNIAAANILAQLEDRKSAARVRRLVEEANPVIRRQYCRVLARFGDDASWRKLETMLAKESYSGTRAHAAFALEKRGKPAVPALIRALKDQSGHVRYAAARSLETVGDRSALPALQQASRESAPDAASAGYMNSQARKAAEQAILVLQQKTGS
jgi:HEAT repeat protein